MARTIASLGAQGEARAAEHLESSGYRILARNVRAGGVELDLVAVRRRVVVFVEVKTRRSSRHGPPEGAVDARKQARLVRGARAWLRENARRPGTFRGARFDVIACTAQPDGSWSLRHLEGAFEADG